jgi:TolB protein
MSLSRQQRRSDERSGAPRPRRPFFRRPVAVLAGLVGAGWLLWAAWDQYSRIPPTRDGSPSWSPDGKEIVFYSERAGNADLFVMKADGTGLVRQLTFTEKHDEGSPAFSPDGRWIAYDTDRDGHGTNFEIYVMDSNGENHRRLTRSPGRDVSPAWSPDGKRIVFMSDRASRPEFDVYVMNADGSGVERVTSKDTNWFPQFSPDGKRLAFHVWSDVHVLDLATKKLQRLTYSPNNGMYPTWSKDGRIAFMSWRNGRTEIFTMSGMGENQERLVSMPTGGAIDPRWSPDGTRIAFVHVSETTPADKPDPTHQRVIYVVDLQGGKLTRLSR